MFHGDYGDVPDAGVDGFVDGQKVCRLITVGAVDPLNRGALGQLAGVTLHVSARRAKFKLGQNRPMETPRRIITEPRKRGRPLDGRAADALERTLSTDDGAT